MIGWRRRIQRVELALSLVLAAGCGTAAPPLMDASIALDAESDASGGADASDAGLLPDADRPDTGVPPGPCAPALEISPAHRAARALDLVSFSASGGTGHYHFALAAAPSGAIINPVTGAYLAGDLGGVQDHVVLTDEGCVGQAEATIDVVAPMDVHPPRPTVRPGTEIAFTVQGGSGQFRFTLEGDRSGATLTSSGAYTAGARAGVDLVRAEDVQTSEAATVEVTVDPGARLAASPPVVVVPLGQSFALGTSGGSGEIDLEPAPGFIAVQDGVLTAQAAGTRSLRITDRFTHDTASVRIQVVAGQRFPSKRAGNGFFVSTALGPGDIDGDGKPDAIFALPDDDFHANTGGVVLIYAGAAGTLTATPARALAGETRAEEFGRSVTVADLDGDGHPELIIGSARADVGASDGGAVYIYAGLVGAFFSAQPTKVLSGRLGGDLFGSSVVACDFNGDGKLDLAVGARGLEDRQRPMVSSDQGGVQVFLQRATGFRDDPDLSLYGDLPDGSGGFAGYPGLLLGSALAAADFDGDGACDLAVASLDWDSNPMVNTNDGLVLVYKGVKATAMSRGGLSEAPVRGFGITAADDTTAQLGRSLAAGDLDGDGLPELVIGEPNSDNGSGDNYGAIRVYRGGPLPAAPITALSSPRMADWSYEHDGDQDQFGYTVAIGDVDGDLKPDLVSGNLRDEASGAAAVGGTGSVTYFPGRMGMMPDVHPAALVAGIGGNDSFGAALAVLGDLSGDGKGDLLVFATTTDTAGRDVGTPYFVDGSFSAPPAPLVLPGVPSGLEFGRGGDIVGDLDGDGRLDLVVGAPRDNSEARGLSTGTAYFYPGTANGFAQDPALVWKDFPGNTTNDLFGTAVSRAGDFDGDGRPDVAILARLEDRPATFDATYAPEALCSGLPAADNVGAIYIFSGVQSGLPSLNPDFVIFGVEVGDAIDAIAGGFDWDGDGKSDLAIGSVNWDLATTQNVGGVAIVRGRPKDPGGKTVVICGLDFVHHSAEAGSQLGRMLVPLGDLDGDGCDEFAAGAYLEDLGTRDQGTVRIFYGAGGGCAAGPRMATVYGGVRDAQFGYALAGDRHDFDGDRRPELAVSAPAYVAQGAAAGGVTVLLGSALAALPTEAPVDGVAPTLAQASGGAISVGRPAGARFGQSLAFVENGARRGLLVGVPLGDFAGPVVSGGALYFDLSARGALSSTTSLVIGGETTRTLGRIGELVATFNANGTTGQALVAGYDGQGGGLDLGSGYAVDLAP
ncbi:MAG: FG-GAP-like repeat-containing protein [Myxococcota bacterium]